MIIVKITREDIESEECPLAAALKRSYGATSVKVNYNNFNKGNEEKPDWLYRGYATIRFDNAQQHPTWKFDNGNNTISYIIQLPKLMTKWVTDFDRIGNARSVTFRLKWHPQQR